MGRIDADYEEKLLLKQDAAEEMYEALREILADERGAPSCIVYAPHIIERIRAVVAKAEGR